MQRESQAMERCQPIRRQLLLLHQLFECCDEWIAWRQVKHGVAKPARPLPGEKGLCLVDLDGFEQEHVGIETQAGVTRHQPHSKKIAELQNSPVAPCPVRL